MSSTRIFYAIEIVVRLGLVMLSYELGAVFYGDVKHFFDQGVGVGIHHLPYRDFVWEFPPLTTLSLFAVPLLSNNNTYFHLVFITVMVGCEWLSLHALRRFQPDRFWLITIFWSVSVLPMGLLVWNRFDFVSVLFVTLALVAFLRKRPVTLWLSLGYLTKLWPAVVVAGYVAERNLKALVKPVGAIAILTAAWFAYSPSGVRSFLEFRQGSNFQVESIPGALLHYFGRPYGIEFGAITISDSGYQWVHTLFAVVLFGGLVALLVFAYVRRNVDAVMLMASCVALSFVSSRIISAQYVVWLVPFLALRIRECRLAVALYVAASVSTFIMLLDYGSLIFNDHTWSNAVLILRNALLVVLLGELVRKTFFPHPAVRVATVETASK